MQLILSRHLWGISESWETVFPRIKAAGFRAVEAPVPDQKDLRRFRSLLDQNDLEYIAMIFTSGKTVLEHAKSFETQVRGSQELRPILINSHSGQDSWSRAQARNFFERVLDMEAVIPMTVAHETHRGRILFNPWVTRDLVQHFENLHLVCDLSHWVCVCERLIDSEIEIIRLCARHCAHLHARVGYEQGPQVPDPRAPEYVRHVETHERWWDIIWDAQASSGQRFSTLTPEFGPPDYLHTLPFSRKPVADLWEVCAWMAERQKKRFAARFAEKM